MNIKVKVYDKAKYDPSSKKVVEVSFQNIQSLKIEHHTDDEIYKMGFDETDEYQEYATIITEDGAESTFRNSHIDIFLNI